MKTRNTSGDGESVYMPLSRHLTSRRRHAIDTPVNRRLAAAATNMLDDRRRRTSLKSDVSNRHVEPTTTGVQLLLAPEHI